MSRIYLILWVLFITYGKCEAFFDNNEVSINLGLRSYPFSGTVDAQFKSEKLLWDVREKARWKFSMIQSKLTLASHGLAEVGLSFFPVGILELGGHFSTTSRFYETKNFDCTIVICKGILGRTSVFARFLAGQEIPQGQLFTYLSSSLTTAKLDDDSKPFVDEVEKLLGKAGGDELRASSFGFGLKRSDGTFLVLLRQAQYKDTKDQNEMAYLIYRTQFEEYNLSAGIGQYQSNRFDSGLSAVFGVSVVDGVTASLF